MMDFVTLGSIVTVLAVIAFAGVVAWTMSRRQDERFDAAARLPFALPDEIAPIRGDGDQHGAGK
jgi:cytochrome c oxidase cbb3-type subunit 4